MLADEGRFMDEKNTFSTFFQRKKVEKSKNGVFESKIYPGRKMVITGSKMDCLGSGRKENVEEGGRNTKITS